MSWVQMLCETYEYCGKEVGKSEFENLTPLLPISHSTQEAQLEAVITENGEWVEQQARVLSKNEATTIIPCTENSATRSGTIPPPHPLFDKLQYLAGDYTDFGGEKGDEFYNQYIQQLEQWCASTYSVPQIEAILKYLKKRTLIEDLMNQGILHCDDKGKLLDKWSGDSKKPPFFEIWKNMPQKDAFIRFRVKRKSGVIEKIWRSEDVWNSFINYYRSQQSNKGLCYVVGAETIVTEKAPAKLRNSGDKAKLISANDNSGFTFRGRFTERSEALSIGYETTQKAHNALKWLISKQGTRNGDQIFLTWGIKNQALPPVVGDTFDLIMSAPLKEVISTETKQQFAEQFNKAISGYKSDLKDNDDVVVMGLDSATPGRLSIIYYREIKGSELLNGLEYWHKTCSWLHQYRQLEDGKDAKGKIKYKFINFFGAPSPKDIVIAAYGEHVNDKLKKSTIERLIPCIISRANIPLDLVRCVAQRASNPAGMESWEYRKCLSIACAIIKKYHNDMNKKEKFDMALNLENRDRSYLFGRLLACAQAMESYAFYLDGEKNRQTNAERFHSQFSKRPSSTWMIIQQRLIPYSKKLGDKSYYYESQISEITDMMTEKDFTNNTLSEIYLLGYASQLQYFKINTKSNTTDSIMNKGEENNE